MFLLIRRKRLLQLTWEGEFKSFGPIPLEERYTGRVRTIIRVQKKESDMSPFFQNPLLQ